MTTIKAKPQERGLLGQEVGKPNTSMQVRDYLKSLKNAKGPKDLSRVQRHALGHNLAKPAPSFRHPVKEGLRFRYFEINRLIEARHHGLIPETDDTAYFEAMAANLRSLEHLLDWTADAAPWASPDMLITIHKQVTGSRSRDLTGQECANLLRVSYGERERLEINTIGSFDVDEQTRAAMAKERKREMDRQRIQARRKAKGAKSRLEFEQQSIEAQKPWEKDGISRRTWFRRRENRNGTGASQVVYNRATSDAPVPNCFERMNTPIPELLQSHEEIKS
jgi:hypothetical protein